MNSRTVKWILYIAAAFLLIQWIGISVVLSGIISTLWLRIFIFLALVATGAMVYYRGLDWIKEKTAPKVASKDDLPES